VDANEQLLEAYTEYLQGGRTTTWITSGGALREYDFKVGLKKNDFVGLQWWTSMLDFDA
jgi:hypothetical protein